MKPLTLALFLVALLVCATATALGQAPPGLSLQLYAGLSVTGQVGRVYQVQYATELSETKTWYALQHFELKWNPHEFVDTTCPVTQKRFYRAVEVEVPTNVVPVANMVFIAPGTFIMGSPPDEPAREEWEGPQTEVTLSRGFWLGKYEVTQGEYLQVVGSNPSYFNGVPFPGEQDYGINLTRPMETVTWFDATNYCALLTERERLADRLPVGYEYRLPTEAQWEYACRAGTRTAFAYGAALRSGMANFEGHYEYPPCGGSVLCYNPSGVWLRRTAEVGSYLPNAWGLYDMHGNVWEWCQDWWADSLPGGSVTDPTGTSMGSYRVHRGGYWRDYASFCRSAYRGWFDPGYRFIDLGFRVALVAVP